MVIEFFQRYTFVMSCRKQTSIILLVRCHGRSKCRNRKHSLNVPPPRSGPQTQSALFISVCENVTQIALPHTSPKGKKNLIKAKPQHKRCFKTMSNSFSSLFSSFLSNAKQRLEESKWRGKKSTMHTVY